MIQELIRQLLFTLDAEKAHAIGQQLIRWRYSAPVSRLLDKTQPSKPTHVFGLTFQNPVGLAAGWDKNGVCIDALFRLGFGFVEVGTVTPLPQPGNPKPRLFRLPEKQALINRMGFNNDGVDALVSRLSARKVPGIVGVNIGKNKDTPLENALDDYVNCLKAVYPHADYCVINISSPNTPGLRALQSKSYLTNLLQGIAQARLALQNQYRIYRPILVKTTVDLPQAEYTYFMRAIMDAHIDGVIISNTTLQHTEKYEGGLSGAPLRERTTQMIRDIKRLSEGQLPIVGVGGIMSSEDATMHWQAGASLLQLYTGFVYRGSSLLQSVKEVRAQGTSAV